MSEKQPNEQNNPYEKPKGAKFFNLMINGERVELHANNTHIYKHEGQPEGDHVFVARGQDEDGDCIGTFIWKNDFTMKDGDDYDEILEILEKVDVGSSIRGVLDDADLERFYTRSGRYPETKGVEQHGLTDRQEKLIEAFGATFGTMAALHKDEFWEDMNTPADYRPYNPRWC